MLDPDDKAAILSLLVRHIRITEARDADTAKKAEIEARLAGYPDQLTKLRTAFSIYGIDTSLDGWGQPIMDAFGVSAYQEAEQKAGRKKTVWSHLAKVDSSANTENAEPSQPEDLNADAPVRDLVLQKLKKAGLAGLKAADLRASIEALRGTTLHEKTIGMTLYRLSIDGLVRRDKRTWFFVPETKNPGAVTPGSINRDTKEGEEP